MLGLLTNKVIKIRLLACKKKADTVCPWLKKNIPRKFSNHKVAFSASRDNDDSLCVEGEGALEDAGWEKKVKEGFKLLDNVK